MGNGKHFYSAGWIFYLDLKAASECIQNANTRAPVSASSGSVRLDQGGRCRCFELSGTDLRYCTNFLKNSVNLVLNCLETFTSTAKKEGNRQYLRVDVVALPVHLGTAVYTLGYPRRLSVSRA